MPRYIFISGNTPTLSQAEQEAILSFDGIDYKATHFSNFSLVEVVNQLNVKNLILRLGGTVKIGQVLYDRDDTSLQDKIMQIIVEDLISQGKNSKRLVFGVSVLTPSYQNYQKKICQGVKELLEEDRISSRYILGKSALLSSVVVVKQQVCEYLVVLEPLVIAKTVAVQDFADWSKRDWGRPAVRPKTGMLPPKVARMMVNIGVGQFRALGSGPVLYDPFCGCGTILNESRALGYQFFGSDIDVNSVTSAKKNLDWLETSYKLDKTGSQAIFVHDATKPFPKLAPAPVITVTEGDLGPPQRQIMSHGHTIELLSRLNEMYAKYLINQSKTLPQVQVVVLALPMIVDRDGHTHHLELVDNCEKFGYTLHETFKYSRPRAFIKREIAVLIKKEV
ncbi:hypothetical protein HY388_01830 [Candidatus Daviesbacteria bacterium]|nr:hypothetical protein [Candidatus Daviesbacteria bacterium]